MFCHAVCYVNCFVVVPFLVQGGGGGLFEESCLVKRFFGEGTLKSIHLYVQEMYIVLDTFPSHREVRESMHVALTCHQTVVMWHHSHLLELYSFFLSLSKYFILVQP